ncbi:MAG TPA: anti-sigma factor [Solirubrobacteraceae bacterium]|nr:anti-sigma factor [Solirubrobacteraceae bacterium]
MTELDRLPPDQRAVLSLVLDRGKSYAEVAAMLAIPEATVRERAHTALDTLATSGGVSRPSAPRPGESVGRPPARSAPSSRRGGAVLLAAIVVAVIVAVVLLTSGKGSSGKGAAAGTTSTTSTSSTSTSAASGAKAHIDKKLPLSAVEPESQATGEAYVLSDGSRRAFYIAAQHLPQQHGFLYAVWLYNSPSSSAPLGRFPTSGRMEGGGPLPTNAADYAKIIVTRETSTHAHHPSTIVLSGPFALH